MDALTIGLLLLFSFLSASFIARNSDVWLHLATGRMLVAGEYRFGSDPFAYTTANRYWANHAWLFDLGFYLSWQWLGGAALVAIKASVLTVTAGFMLLATRGKGALWIGSVCVLLGVLVMSQRVPLQPVMASYLLLAACLCCLRSGGGALRAVPMAIALWVNLDGWFILGPMLVGLFWLGRKLKPSNLEPPTAWPTWLIPGSILACLLSPHHIHAFVLPFELTPAVWMCSFSTHPQFAGVFISPWHWRVLGAAGGYNLAMWAFFIILVLGIASFGINRDAIRSWRATVWLTFAILAAWQVRLIPFFAVVGAPICGLNFREAFAATTFLRLGRAVALVAGFALIGLGWLGLENGFHNRDRAIAWNIHTDATLSRAASGIAHWRQEANVSAEARVFTTHPDLGHYLAWFAPAERCFLDSRLSLFTPVAEDYTVLSRAIGLLPNEDVDRIRIAELFQTHRTKAIVLYDPDFQRMTSALRQVTAGEPQRWDVVRIDGGAVLLTPEGITDEPHRFNAERMAFGMKHQDQLRRAENGPATLVEPAPWWLIEPSAGRIGSWEADAATVYLRLFEDSQSPRTDRSPALPLLAVRAARVGIESDPTDSTAWLMLARAYQRLSEQTWERDVGEVLTPLSRIRRTQIVAALVQAVLLNPDSAPAHDLLAGEFLRGQVLDLAYKHSTEYLRLMRRTGPNPGESHETYSERIANVLGIVDRLEGSVQDAENRYLIRTATLSGDPLARAKVAEELGLLQKAIDVLLASHHDLYGIEGLGLLLDILLRTGKVVEARAILNGAELRGNPDVFGNIFIPGKPHPGGHRWNYKFGAYDWFDLCESTAAGRYEGAQGALHRLGERLEREERMLGPALSAALTRQLTIEVGLAAPPNFVLARLTAGRERSQLGERLGHIRFLTVARGDLATLAGVLELERGNVLGASEQGNVAIALYTARKDTAPALPGEPLAKRYVDAIRQHR
ncbi:MAG TPA: hypothetical protein VG122_19435 [Gemmata sp.]|nr:hypothetical protein [Gemmata sp.]